MAFSKPPELPGGGVILLNTSTPKWVIPWLNKVHKIHTKKVNAKITVKKDKLIVMLLMILRFR
jgi:hypothetical protein